MIHPQEKNYHSYLRTFRGNFAEVENQADKPNLTPTNVLETDDSYEIQVALPGYRKDQLHIKVDEDVLSIRAEAKSVRQQTSSRYHKREIFAASFEKSILLPEDINDEHIRATFRDGLLNINLPKSNEPVKASADISIK